MEWEIGGFVGRRLALLVAAVCLGSPLPVLGAVNEFGQIAVGSTTTANVAIPLTPSQLAAGPKIALHYGIDFSTGACAPASSGCQLAVTFAPQSPGSRVDAVVVKDTVGNVITKIFLHGTGIGPLGAFVPGVVSVRYTPGSFSFVHGLAVDQAGAVYFVSGGTTNQAILKLGPGQSTPQTVVGVGTFPNIGPFALDAAGDIFLVNYNGISEVEAETGSVTTLPISNLIDAQGIAIDSAGNVFVLDDYHVQRWDVSTGVVSLYVGGGSPGFSGDGGPAANADLYEPRAIALNAIGDLFISEGDGRLRKVDAATQIIQTVAGNGNAGYSGDGGPAAQAQLGDCWSITVDAVGNLYVADFNFFVVRKIDAATGIISTLAGKSVAGSLQEGVLASDAQFVFPAGIAVDSSGNLFFASSYITGIYEVTSSAPTLPFTWPGSFGTTPVDNESIVNIGNAPLTISSATVSGPFSLQADTQTTSCAFPVTLTPGVSCGLAIGYNSGQGTAEGSLTLFDNYFNETGGEQQAAFKLLYPQALLSTSSFAFGTGFVGGGSGFLLTINNPSNAPLLIQSIAFSGPNGGDFSYNGSDCGPVVARQSNCEFDVNFAPNGVGARNATLVLTTNGLDTPETVALTGSAVLPGTLVASTAGLDFTGQSVGTTSIPQTITLTNTGGGILTFPYPPFFTGNGPFSVTSQTCSYGLSPGASCQLGSAFSPSTPGTAIGAFFLQWGAVGIYSTNVLNIPLIGTTDIRAGFQPVDNSTIGNWPSRYGSDGYLIANEASAIPAYATVNVSGASTWTWLTSTSDPRALLKTVTSTDRIASTYYAANSFTIDLTLTGGIHQVSLYLLDYDSSDRAETISLLDPDNNNALLDSRSFSGFHNGQWAVWNIQGHVLIQVTCTGGLNALVSGLFFKTLGTVNPAAVSLTSPPAGAISGSVTVTANAQSSAAIQSVQFLLDGNNLGAPVTTGSNGNYSIVWTTATAPNGPHTLSATATDTAGQSSTAAGVSVTVSNVITTPSNSAVFLRSDTSTQGNWKDNYGAKGELIANDSPHPPVYGTVGLGTALQWTWAASTSDPRALTKYGSNSDRIASAYYNTSSFTYDVNLTDSQPHQVALYLLDYDGGRTETVSILDAASNQVLDTRTLSNFGGGQYLVWTIQGHVLMKLQLLYGVSAAASGLFFGTGSGGTSTVAPPNVSITSPGGGSVLSNAATLSAAASSTGATIASVQFALDGTYLAAPLTVSPYTFQWNTLNTVNGSHTLTAIATDNLSQQTTSAPVSVTVSNGTPVTSAVFTGRDTTTGGSWKTVYGGDGETIANDSNNPPVYGMLTFSGAANWTWLSGTTDQRALQQAAGASRIASTFYATNNFTLDVNITDNGTHQLALYFLDWDDGGRAQNVSILDANTQAVLDTEAVANFRNGAYLIWNIKGHVTVQFSRIAGQNAVLSGVFFAP